MEISELKNAQGVLGLLCAVLLVGVILMLGDVKEAVESPGPGGQVISQTITVNGEPKKISTTRLARETGDTGEDAWLDRHDRTVEKARRGVR